MGAITIVKLLLFFQFFTNINIVRKVDKLAKLLTLQCHVIAPLKKVCLKGTNLFKREETIAINEVVDAQKVR